MNSCVVTWVCNHVVWLSAHHLTPSQPANQRPSNIMRAFKAVAGSCRLRPPAHNQERKSFSAPRRSILILKPLFLQLEPAHWCYFAPFSSSRGASLYLSLRSTHYTRYSVLCTLYPLPIRLFTSPWLPTFLTLAPGFTKPTHHHV